MVTFKFAHAYIKGVDSMPRKPASLLALLATVTRR